MRFYDSASATIREFEPVVPGEARIYYCGATVQGEPHLGHIRSALVFDQLSRWMRYRGLKVTTESAWFAARPSGTEDVYKIYAESFKGAEHLAEVQEAAKQVVSDALNG